MEIANRELYIAVVTNVVKTSLTLIDKHFPRDKNLSKIFEKIQKSQ